MYYIYGVSVPSDSLLIAIESTDSTIWNSTWTFEHPPFCVTKKSSLPRNGGGMGEGV